MNSLSNHQFEISLQALESFYNNRPVLVTGGAGFIGSHLVEALVSLHARVTVLDDLTSSSLENLEHVWDRITFIKDSITNFDACLQAAYGQQAIFHLAAATSVPASLQSPQHYFHVNVSGCETLLEAARINQIERFFFASSCAVYGAQAGPLTEECQTKPTSPYGYTKLLGELLCKEYREIFQINTIIGRFFNVYGTRQNPSGPYASVVASFDNNLKNNHPITIFGDGSQTRDFVHVSEVVKSALFLTSRAPEIAGEIFNIASGTSLTILHVLEKLKREYPDSISEINFLPARPGDVLHCQADCSKLGDLIANNHISFEQPDLQASVQNSF